MRTIEQTIGSIREHLLDVYNPDVFICTYNTYFSYSNQDPFNSKSDPNYVKDEDLKRLFGDKLKSYQIMHHEIAAYQEEVSKNNLPERNFMQALSWRSYSMMDAIRRAIWLRQDYEKSNNVGYDVVILMRPDLILATKVKIEGLDLNKVWGSISHQAPIYGTSPQRLFGDHLLVSKNSNIDIFATLYDQIGTLYKKGWSLNNESLMGATLLENNIEFERSDFVYHGVQR